MPQFEGLAILTAIACTENGPLTRFEFSRRIGLRQGLLRHRAESTPPRGYPVELPALGALATITYYPCFARRVKSFS